jgi:hypothetical protein
MSIEKCFLAGVVPSHLLSQENRTSPTPISIINAAYTFYLASMPNLLARLVDYNQSNLTQRAAMTAKLENWTIKALDDHQLYAGTIS